MTERIAKFVEDDESSDNLIERVQVMTHEDAPSVDTADPFLIKNDSLKEVHNLSPNLKRRRTNEIKKFHRGDGAESKQITDETEYTGYDMFGVVTPPHSLEGFAKLYEMSAPHYSAVNAKVSNIVGLGYKFVETPATKRALEDADSAGNEAQAQAIRKKIELHREELHNTLDSFNEEETITEIFIKVWIDYEVTGNGYLEIGRKRDGTVGYIGHIPAQTIRIRKERDGFVQLTNTRKAVYFRNFGDTKSSNPVNSDKPNEIIHIKKYSPTSTYYGIPDVLAAEQAIAGNEFSARFNLEYFENKAVPRHVITLKGAKLGAAAQSQILSFFETGLKGQNHRSLFIPLPQDDGTNKVEFKFEKVESDGQDSSFNNYRKANTAEILMAHRVPITKVSVADSASLAIARDADKTFKEQVCAPQQRIFEKKVNRIIKEITEVFTLKLNEMTLTDADTQSKIDERMVKTGIWLRDEPRRREGMPALPEGKGQEIIDLNAKGGQQRAEERTTRERDSERSANSPDSSGESRNPKGEGRQAV